MHDQVDPSLEIAVREQPTELRPIDTVQRSSHRAGEHGDRSPPSGTRRTYMIHLMNSNKANKQKIKQDMARTQEINEAMPEKSATNNQQAAHPVKMVVSGDHDDRLNGGGVNTRGGPRDDIQIGSGE